MLAAANGGNSNREGGGKRKPGDFLNSWQMACIISIFSCIAVDNESSSRSQPVCRIGDL
jgi:hypothetical protein